MVSRNGIRAFRILCIAVLCAAVMISCTPARKPATPLRVTVFPYLSFAPLYIAQAEGYFARNGLDVEFVRFQGNSESLPALLTGRIDVDAIFTVGLLNAVAHGESVRVVANKGLLSPVTCQADGFMARAGLAERLTDPSPEFLKTLTFGVDPTWVDSYFLDRALTRWGLSLDDVRTEYVPNPAARMAALASGALDVAFFSEPWISRVQESGDGLMWLPASAIVPDYSLGVLTFGPRLLASKQGKDSGVRFLRAYLQGIAQLNKGKTPRNIEILAEATQLDAQELARICWPSFDARGQVNAAAIGDYSAWTVARGLSDRVLTPADFWDPRFIEAAAGKTHGRP